MALATKLNGSDVLHGVLYPKFEEHRLGIITNEGEEYEIIDSRKLSQLAGFLYEPVRVTGKFVKDRSRIKVHSLEPENQPPETDGVSVQTTAFPSLASI